MVLRRRQAVAAAPSDQDTPAPNKSIFHHQASQHQSHHYLLENVWGSSGTGSHVGIWRYLRSELMLRMLRLVKQR